MIKQIRAKAKELLKSKQVDLVIGHKRAADGISAAPAFIDNEEDVNSLIWDGYCVYNLASYLKDFSGKKIGIIAKGCEVRAITVLLQENQLKREDIFIIGIECYGVIDESKARLGVKKTNDVAFDRKCKVCDRVTPQLYDVLIKETSGKKRPAVEGREEYGAVRKLEAKSLEERGRLWREEFSRCIRCYACRQICPMCYCPRCVAEQTMPAWFSKAPSLEGNLAWNVTRAIHLAGRCIDCGECERACPVGIPLKDINKKIQKDIEELFAYEAGSSAEQKPLFSSFDKADPDDFIR